MASCAAADGNLFEFGWNVKQAWPNKHIDCSAAARARSNATQLLCHTQRLLKERYGAALLFSPEKSDPNSGELVCGGLDGSCIMDPVEVETRLRALRNAAG